MQLKMFRPPDLPLPDFPPPQGFSIRAMLPGEEEAWSYCCLGEFGIGEVSPRGFREKIGDIPPSEVFYICAEGDRPVGTATAQLLDGRPFLHYIALHPDWRRRGLARPLICAVLRRHAALGRSGCYLTTDDPRLPAIHTYIKMGYLPVLWSDDAAGRWRDVMAKLGIDALETYRTDGESRGEALGREEHRNQF